MIRINLLPIREQRRRRAAIVQLLVFVGILLAELAIIAFLYYSTSSELDDLKSEVGRLQQEVKTAEAEIKDAKVLEEQAKTLDKQLGVLKELEKKRSGPVRVLDEMQAILSKPRNGEDRVHQIKKNWNVEWEPGRLWVLALKEKEGEFEMSGKAVSADDVAEFLQRLNTAKHFADVKLDFVKAEADPSAATGARNVVFRVTGKIYYSGSAPVEVAPAGPPGRGRPAPRKK